MEILHDLKMQFVHLLLVMWIFWGQIGHKNYKDFEHPTCKGKSFVNSQSFKAFALTGRQVCEHDNPGRCPGLRASAPSGRANRTGRNFFCGFSI